MRSNALKIIVLFSIFLWNFGMCVAIVGGYMILENLSLIMTAHPLLAISSAIYFVLLGVLIGMVSLANAAVMTQGVSKWIDSKASI